MLTKLKTAKLLILGTVFLSVLNIVLAWALSSKEVLLDGKAFLIVIFSFLWMYFFNLYKEQRHSLVMLWLIFTVMGFVVPWIAHCSNPLM